MVEKKVLDEGDRVEIQYGHPTFLTKEEWKVIKDNTPNGVNDKPKNIIHEDDKLFIIDVCSYLKGQEDVVSKKIKVGEYFEYELKNSPREGWYTRNQLKLL